MYLQVLSADSGWHVDYPQLRHEICASAHMPGMPSLLVARDSQWSRYVRIRTDFGWM